MSASDHRAYPPLNTLKAVCDDVWVVDGPVIRFGPPGLNMPFPTRMTVVRLAGGDMFILSPSALTPALRAGILDLGRPSWIIGPNRIHYWWITDWKRSFEGAEVYLAPRIPEQAGDRVDFDHRPLEGSHGYPWDGEILTLPVEGRFMTEVEFLHRASRTLILTDLIENFEADKLGLMMRGLTWLGGVLSPDGQMPRDMRRTFSKRNLRTAVDTLIAWNPERVILAHGRWYRANGADELRRAFRWLPPNA